MELTAQKNDLLVSHGETITSGSIGIYTCQFVFSPDWDGLSKTAVFSAGDIRISALLDSDNRCQIPWEVLQTPVRKLYAGVYGTRDGNIVLPTTWAYLGEIQKGTIPGEASEEPTPGAYEQIAAIAQQLLEDADAGRFDGADGITPHIGENGNWWIGTEDTGRPSQSGGNAIVCEVSGEVIHIADSSQQPIRGLTIYGKSTQNRAPAPEAPVEIVSVGDTGEMTVTTVCRKNLLEYEAANSAKANVTIAVQKNGAISFTGAASYTFSFDLCTMYLKPGVYTIGGSIANTRVSISYHNGTSFVTKATSDNGNAQTFVITQEEQNTRFYIGVGVYANQSAAELVYPILVAGDTIGPYQSTTAALTNNTHPDNPIFPLRGIPVSSGGNVSVDGQAYIADTVEVNADGTGRVVKRCGIIDSYNGESVGNVYLSAAGSLASGATVIYPLETDAEIPLTAAEVRSILALKTYKPVTNVFNDGGAYQTVAYVADTKNYIDNKFAQLAAQIVANA